ncbi:DUF1715 domain-containing protein [Diplocarpon rosae]|nr:DUF1715 domain-containing protein [Diplocarpon rosae]
MAAHNFDELLTLEEQFYSEGFQQGMDDGVAAGRVEGRTFGLEKGFEKYIESGRLYGKSLVWANRISRARQDIGEPALVSTGARSADAGTSLSSSPCLALRALPENHRLAKHIRVLHALAEPESLSTENTEEAVSDFDDRLKRAQGKAKVIERIVGESKADPDPDPDAGTDHGGQAEGGR